MSKFQGKYRVESARLKEWNYSNPYWYFVTINTKNNKEFFGKVIDEEVTLNASGRICLECLNNIPFHFPFALLDYFVVMPNHVHAIIVIGQNSEVKHGDVACNVSTNVFSKISPGKGSLSVIVRSFKSAVTKQIHNVDYPDFQWQSRFFDRIIRNEKELFNIRKYISENPLRWEMDRNSDNIF